MNMMASFPSGLVRAMSPVTAGHGDGESRREVRSREGTRSKALLFGLGELIEEVARVAQG